MSAAINELSEMKARKDAAYLERNQVVAALAKAYPSGLRKTAIEGWGEDWHGCVMIDLPTGQASWHYHDSQAHLFADLPAYAGEWDGHTTDEKYARLAAMTVQAAPVSPLASNDLETLIQILDTLSDAVADDGLVLPLFGQSEAALDKWDFAITTIMKNLGAYGVWKNLAKHPKENAA